MRDREPMPAAYVRIPPIPNVWRARPGSLRPRKHVSRPSVVSCSGREKVQLERSACGVLPPTCSRYARGCNAAASTVEPEMPIKDDLRDDLRLRATARMGLRALTSDFDNWGYPRPGESDRRTIAGATLIQGVRQVAPCFTLAWPR